MSVLRVLYNNKYKKNTNIEIVSINDFFNRVKLSFLKKDYRLDFYSLIYVTKGKASHSINFKEYQIEKDNLVVLEKDKIHAFRDPKNIEGYIININKSFFMNSNNSFDYDLLSFFELPIETPILKINTNLNQTNRILIDLLYKEYEKSVYDEKLLSSIFFSFIYSIKQELKDVQNSFTINSYKTYFKFRELVNEEYSNIKDVQDYAKILGISYKTINKSCKECTDISAKQIIINKLIIEAKRLIISDDLTNYEIAYKLGFDDPSNFSHFFKKHVGINIKDYRKTI